MNDPFFAALLQILEDIGFEKQYFTNSRLNELGIFSWNDFQDKVARLAAKLERMSYPKGR